MTQDLLRSEAAPALWKESLWERLLGHLDDGTVIPIVGPDLLQVEVDGNSMLLDQFIARRLAQTFNLPADNLPPERALNAVVSQLVRSGNNPHNIRDEIRVIMGQSNLEPSRPLRQLAEITDFNLFVSITFDTLLESAINEIRFGGATETMSIVYCAQ